MAQNLTMAPVEQISWSKKVRTALLALLFAAVASAGMYFSSAGVVRAAHNGASVDINTVECGETTFTASITDPAGTHKVSNMRLVVDVNGDAEFTDVIPTNGDSVEVTVGPFSTPTQTISWRVFGGGERGYDNPLWNGFGTSTFGSDINDYAAEVGTFNWVVAGTTDPNPFTTWHEIEVEGCVPQTKDDCKDDGWAAFDFKNQGQCIQFVNTGKDSR